MSQLRPVRPPEPPVRPGSFDQDMALYQDKLTIYAADMADYLAVQMAVIEKHLNDMLIWRRRILN